MGSMTIRLALVAALATLPLVGQSIIVPKKQPAAGTITRHGASEEIGITFQDGKVVVTIDGRKAPADRVEIRARSVRIKDPRGRRYLSLTAEEGGVDFTASSGKRKKERRIGVSLREIDGVTATHLDLEPHGAMIVTSVQGEMPALKAGIVPNDIIVAIDGEKATLDRLKSRLQQMDDGEGLELEVISRGKRRRIELKPVVVAPSPRGRIRAGLPREGGEELRGVVLDDVTTELRGVGGFVIEAPDAEAKGGETAPSKLRFAPVELWATEKAKGGKSDDDLTDLARRVGELQEKLERIEAMLKKLADR